MCKTVSTTTYTCIILESILSIMRFVCRHVTAADMNTLMLDRSVRMGSHTINPDNRDIRSHAYFNPNLDNVLGVAYVAAYKYLQERSAKAPQDMISFIPCDHIAMVSPYPTANCIAACYRLGVLNISCRHHASHVLK